MSPEAYARKLAYNREYSRTHQRKRKRPTRVLTPEQRERKREKDRKRVRPARPCVQCGVFYTPKGGKDRYCPKHRGQYRNGQPRKYPASRISYVHCDQCGKLFTTRTNAKRCSEQCKRRAHSIASSASIKKRYAKDPAFRDKIIALAQSRRATKLGLGNTEVLLSYLIERDAGICGICHEPVTEERGTWGPSIDHIIPLSKGGAHELGNVQLAHRFCNYSKGNRVESAA